MNNIHFVAGMPRSGSTLLCNILCQNPRFRATGTSPLPSLLVNISQTWNSSSECKANYTDQDKLHLLRSVMDNYHLPFGKEITFDKSRAWTSYIELLLQLLDTPPKIIVCTRYMPAIVSSFEKLWRKEIANYGSVPTGMFTLEDRVRYWTDKTQIVGSSYHGLQDAVQRGHKQLLHRVDFFDLTTNPELVMRSIHEFLEEPWFAYDFDNVVQVINEKDEFHGFSDNLLHTIRPKVEFRQPDFIQILGPVISEELGKVTYDFLN